ncbi:MAG: acyltransferase [Rubrivivax sp.]|nr:acyltransferase [Rubrivivax sp.]
MVGGWWRAGLALLLLGLNTLICCSVLFALALLRLLLPLAAVRRLLDPLINGVASTWIAGNSAWMRLTQRTRWDVSGLDDLPYRGWYLVSCNHQSWVDIFVLQHLFNRRIPLLKFFLKHELIYVPVMGLAWWALDFPFMRRHSEAELRRHPEKRQQDLDATRRACAKFALTPTSVMNFVEGTRFTPAKQQRQGSGFEHLLQPKAGGLAMALAMLGERFDSLLDVTIVYPDGAPTFGQFLRGEMRRVIVRVERRPIPLECRRDDGTVDADFRRQVQRWLLELWQLKDAQISALLQAARAADAAPPAPLKA